MKELADNVQYMRILYRSHGRENLPEITTINALVDLVEEMRVALKDAAHECNIIRARDGAPQHIDWHQGRPLQTSSCTHEWFNTVVEQADAALTKADALLTGLKE